MKEIITPLDLWSLVVFVLVSCGNPGKNSGTFFVSPAGDDANSGIQPGHAWKTIAKVNEADLEPGNAVLFQGGSTFEGTLELTLEDSGTAAAPVVISSYGDGYAVINGGDSASIKANNCNYLSIKKLALQGNGRNGGNRSDGLYVAGSSYTEIDSLEIWGFQHSGLNLFKCSNAGIQHVYAHDNGFAGIHVAGTTIWEHDTYDNNNIYIAYCIAENNPGDPTVLKNHSGNGILASSVRGGKIEYCEAFNNGWDMPWTGNGPVGIWIWDCTDFVIQHCISHDNKTHKDAADGGGFDLDGGVSNSIVQYCLSYNNQGPGIGLFEFGATKAWENNTIRYNISVDDGKNGQGSLAVWLGEAGGTIRNCEIYNNTFYNSNPAGPNLCFMDNLTGFNFRNNVFVFNGSILYKNQSIRDELFQNNCYWNLTGNSSFLGYSSLAQWVAATGKELKDGKLVGVYTNPFVHEPAKPDLKDPAGLNREALSGFIPGAGFPLVDAGFDIRTIPGPGAPVHDISGTMVPLGSAFDIGALEYDPEASTPK